METTKLPTFRLSVSFSATAKDYNAGFVSNRWVLSLLCKVEYRNVCTLKLKIQLLPFIYAVNNQSLKNLLTHQRGMSNVLMVFYRNIKQTWSSQCALITNLINNLTLNLAYWSWSICYFALTKFVYMTKVWISAGHLLHPVCFTSSLSDISSLYNVLLTSYTPLFSRIHGSPPDFFRFPANVFSTSKLPSSIRSTSSCNNLFLPFWAWLPRRHSCLHHLFLCIILCSRPLLSLSHQERHHLSNCLSVNLYSIFFYT